MVICNDTSNIVHARKEKWKIDGASTFIFKMYTLSSQLGCMLLYQSIDLNTNHLPMG